MKIPGRQYKRGMRVKLKGHRGWWMVNFQHEHRINCSRDAGPQVEDKWCDAADVTHVQKP